MNVAAGFDCMGDEMELGYGGTSLLILTVGRSLS